MNQNQFKQWQQAHEDKIIGRSFTNGLTAYLIVEQGHDLALEVTDQIADNIMYDFDMPKDKTYNLSLKAMVNMIDIAILDEIVSEWLGEE